MAKTRPASPDWTEGFTKATGAPTPRIIGLSYGEFATGKSAFWLGAPGPIAYFDFDEGTEGVIEDFQETKDIYVMRHSWSPLGDDAQDEAIRVRDEFAAQFEAAIQSARTVVCDKGSQLWEIVRYAEFGAPNGQPRDYYPLNKFMTRLFSMAKATTANFGMIDGMKTPWAMKSAGGKPALSKTTDRVRRGFDEADEHAHVVLFHEKDDDGNFMYTVQKSRGPGAHTIQGQTRLIANDPEDKLNAFKSFAMEVFPDSDDEDWA